MELPVQSDSTLVELQLSEMDVLHRTVAEQTILYLVQRAIMCPHTGFVLDVRDCLALADEDGDVIHVAHQSVDSESVRASLRERTSCRYVVIR